MFHRWTEDVFLVLGAVAALAVLGQRLPLQNLVGMGLTILVASLAIELVGVRSGFPFGRYAFQQPSAYRMAGEIPWAVPFAWVCLVVTSRGAAQEILRPWRVLPGHGFRVLGGAAVLVLLLASGLESFGTGIRLYRDDGPWIPWAGWLLSAMAVLALAFPWWIDKRPVPPVTDRQPFAMWCLLEVLFAVAAARAGRWPYVAMAMAATCIVLLLVGVPILRQRFRVGDPDLQAVTRR